MRILSSVVRLFVRSLSIAALWLAIVSPLRAQTATFANAQVPLGSGFSFINCLALDASGNLYVADFNNLTLSKINPSTGVQTTIVNGQSFNAIAVDRSGNIYAALREEVVVYSPEGNGPYPVMTSGLSNVSSIAVDNGGALFVADEGGNAIYRVQLSSLAVTTVAGTWTSPESIGVDQYDNLYVSEEPASQSDPWLYELNSGGQQIQITTDLQGQGDPLFVDPYGNIYVSDSASGAIIKIPSLTVTPQPFLSGLNQPGVIAVDAQGNLFAGLVAGSVTEIETGSVRLPATPVCAAGKKSPSCQQTATLNFEVNDPANIKVSGPYASGPSGTEYSLNATQSTCGSIASGSSCYATVTFAPSAPGLRLGSFVLKSPSEAVLSTVSLSGVGLGPQVGYRSSTLRTIAKGLSNPSSVTVDGAGNVFIADTGNQRLLKVAPGGAQQSIDAGGLFNPSAVAVDGGGNVLLANAGNGFIEAFAYQTETSSAVQSGLSQPEGIAISPIGDIYISEAGSGLVVRLLPNGGTPIKVLSGVINPTGLAFDSAGDLFAALSGSNLVYEESATGFTSTELGEDLKGPEGVAVDAAGDVFISDTGNDRVVELPAGGGAQQTIVSGLKQPAGIALDKAGNLYIADSGNDRVVELVRSTAPALAFPKTQVDKTAAKGPQTLELINDGNLPLTFSDVGFPPDFPADSNAGSEEDLCASGVSIAPGAGCGIAVNFVPLRGGALSESIKILDNSLNGAPATQTVSLTGKALLTQTIAFLPPSKVTFGVAPLNLATVTAASSGLGVTFKVLSGPATLKGAVLTFKGAGNVVVEAKQAGNGNYEPATPVKKTIVVAKAAALRPTAPRQPYTGEPR